MDQHIDHPLTKFRNATHLSRAELARRAGTSRQTIHRIEVGEQTPSLSLVQRLIWVAKDAGVELSADEFLTDTEAA